MRNWSMWMVQYRGDDGLWVFRACETRDKAVAAVESLKAEGKNASFWEL